MSRRRGPSTERPGQDPFELLGLEAVTDRRTRAGKTASPTEPCAGAHKSLIRLENSRTVSARTSCCVFVFFLVEGLAGEQDSAVESVGQTTVTATELHCDDDELGERLHLPRERSVDTWVAKTETDGAVGRDDLEEDREQGKGVVVCVFKTIAFDDGNQEKTQEDEPQVEGELATKMVTQVARVFFVCVVVIVGPDAERLFFVDVRLAHTHCDGEDGYVHHNQVTNLNGRVEIGDVNHGKTGGTGGCSLEKTIEEPESRWEGNNGGVVELQLISQSLRGVRYPLTSRMMKKIKSTPFSRIRTQKSHQLA